MLQIKQMDAHKTYTQTKNPPTSREIYQTDSQTFSREKIC